MDVGIRIKNFIDAKGMTQTFLSAKSDIPVVKLNLILNGKRRLSLEEYIKLCWALDVSVGTFLEPHPPEKAS
jgi:transcriptional regulator with XRE-family HTH domain